MKSIRRSLIYVFAIICGLTFCGNTVLAGEVVGNLTVSGDVEVNNDVTTVGGDATNSQGGRAKLVFKANSGMMGDLIVAGEGAIEAKQDGTVGGGDYYLQIGGSGWDITMGRKGGEGLYTAGQDIAGADAADGVGRYAVDKASQGGVGGFNLNFAASDAMKFQLRIQNGSDDDDGNQIGFRPWVSLSLGSIGVVAAYETLNKDSGATDNGYGIKVTGSLGAVDVGLNYTSGTSKDSAADAVNVTTNSSGALPPINMMAGSFGLGVHQNSSDGDTEQDTFVSYKAPLPVEGSSISVGYEMSKNDDSEANQFRIRFNYAF